MPRRMLAVTEGWLRLSSLMANTGNTQGIRLSNKPPNNAPSMALSKAQVLAGGKLFGGLAEEGLPDGLVSAATGAVGVGRAGQSPSIFSCTVQACGVGVLSSTNSKPTVLGVLLRKLCKGASSCH